MENISIIGIGRLGICAALCLESVGYKVLGVDVSDAYVNSVNNRTLSSSEPNVEEMLKRSKNLRATTDIKEALNFSKVILIYVATPSCGGEKHYDHTMLGNVLTSINNEKVSNKHIVIGCTVMPTYIKNIGLNLIRDCVNTTLSYNPEFIAQGSIIRDFFNPDMVLIGEGSKEAGDLLENMYNRVTISDPVISRMSPSSAEITKLSVNCFITTKIAFANMIGDLVDLTEDANKFDILSAVGSDSRIGKKYIMPAYSYGGPCFPRDNRALGGYMKQLGLDPFIPTATDISNNFHNKFQAEKILKELRENNINEYVIEGAGYKAHCKVPIIEESAKLIIGKYLASNGIKVIVKDTKALVNATRLEYGKLFEYDFPNEGEHDHAEVDGNHEPGFYTEKYFIKGFTARSLAMIKGVDAAIVLNGRIGTLSEFGIAVEEGLPLAVIEGTGGITDELQRLTKLVAKEFPNNEVIFEKDYKKAVDFLIKNYKNKL